MGGGGRGAGWLAALVALALLDVTRAIYEDQIGKFDWRQTYIGPIKLARLDTMSTARKIIVATEENVLAALNLKTGQIIWRHVLESTSQGNIQMLHVGDKVVTVTGTNPHLVRGWDSTTGFLVWEWSLTLQNSNQAAYSEWWVSQGSLYHLMPAFGSHLEVTTYNAMTGQNRGSTQRIAAKWVNEDCVLSLPYYTCVSGNFGTQYIFSLDITSADLTFITKPLSDYVDWAKSRGSLRELDGASVVPAFVLDSKVLAITDGDYIELKTEARGGSVAIVDSASGPVVLQTWSQDKRLHLSATELSSGAEVSDISFSTEELDVPEPVLSAALCTRSSREQNACRFLIIGYDDSVSLLQQGGRVHWTREEALANIVAAEFVDLPVSELDAAIETEFDQKEGDILGSLTRRLHTQAQQLAAFMQGLLRAVLRGARTELDDDSTGKVALVRDDFDLHKIILAVTEAGKIFGIDNLSGVVLWARNVEGLVGDRSVSIYVRRSARHPPHDAHVTIIGSHSSTGNGLLVSLNPITGELRAEGVLHLDYRLKQTALLPDGDSEHLRAIVLLDEEDSVQVLPVSSSHLVQDFYMFVAEEETTQLHGYALKYDGTTVNAVKTWSQVLGGSVDAGHRIVRIVPKSPLERVHSHGKVMGDRSVLYKYINPNLVVFITEGPDPVHKDVVHMTCVDVVSGAVVASQSHKRARASSYAIHTDNLIAYAYYKDNKQRRTEIATVELYEGASRSLPPGAAFSSLAEQRISPFMERQAYILPATLTAMAETITERGIADKHVLLSLSTGVIIEMPWAYLDPRRPLGMPTPEHREEGLIQYAPELPLPSEAAINYNRTLHRTQTIHTAPSGLESTCLVFAYGLDLFYTRVAPSKTFDLLKDDFDYYLITLVLAALTLATYSSKYFASRKMLKQAWK